MARQSASRIPFAVRGSIARGELPALCRRLAMLLPCGAPFIVECDVRELHADAVSVEALARLKLTVLRNGGRLRLSHVSVELRQLIRFVGLDEELLHG